MPFWQISFQDINRITRGIGAFNFNPPPSQPSGTIPWSGANMVNYEFTFRLDPAHPITFSKNRDAFAPAGYITYNNSGGVTAISNSTLMSTYDSGGNIVTLTFSKYQNSNTWSITPSFGPPVSGSFGLMPGPG